MVRAMRTASRDPAKNATFLATTVSSGERKQFIYLDAAWMKEEQRREEEDKKSKETSLLTLQLMDEKQL